MKHNDAVIRRYCRAVGKRLPLPAAQRRQLLAGLRDELTEAAQDCASLDALIAQAGTPERGRYLLAAVLIVLAVCCAALIYAQVLTDSSVAYAEEHITILPTTDLSEAGQ